MIADLILTNLNQIPAGYYEERQRMELGELGKDICLDCGKDYDFCTCDPALRLGFKVPNQLTIQEVNDGIMAIKEAEERDMSLTGKNWIEIIKDSLKEQPPLSEVVINALDMQQDELQGYKEAYNALYEILGEVGDILERGIRDGEPGHKWAIHKALDELRKVK